jgi:FkbM family methyltransferase
MNLAKISNRTLFGRLLRLPLRVVPQGFCLPILQGPAKGLKWITGTADHGVWLGTYEYHKQRLFGNLIAPGSVVFDIGAHAGFYTLLAARKVGDAGHVYAFEPLATNCVALRKHLEINHLNNVTLFEGAVSDFVGTTPFAPGISTSLGRLSEFGSELVAVTSLDACWQSIPQQHHKQVVIKIDVEGAEVQVLQGAKAMIQTARPRILIATHTPELQEMCKALLHEMRCRVLTNQELGNDELLAESVD